MPDIIIGETHFSQVLGNKESRLYHFSQCGFALAYLIFFESIEILVQQCQIE